MGKEFVMGKKGPKCPVCWGRGWTYPENGDPVKDQEICMECSGTGFQDRESNDGLRLGRESK
jgi:DnaJ-class molecular chaperone